MTASGTWRATVESPVGSSSFVLEMVQTDDGLTGTASSAGDTVPLNNGKVEGIAVSWEMTVNKPMKMTLAFTLIQTGDSMSGIAKPKIFPASKVTAVRVS